MPKKSPTLLEDLRFIHQQRLQRRERNMDFLFNLLDKHPTAFTIVCCLLALALWCWMFFGS